MITQLKNPKTDQYYKVKEYIFSKIIPWYRIPDTGGVNIDRRVMIPKKNRCHVDTPYFSHAFLLRPDDGIHRFPYPASPMLGDIESMLYEIWDYNKIDVKCIFRIGANLVEPTDKDQYSPPHVDHSDIPHNNMIIYFTDSGGETVVHSKLPFNRVQEFSPKEDDIITFDGLPHYIKLPRKKSRIVLVVTYF